MKQIGAEAPSVMQGSDLSAPLPSSVFRRSLPSYTCPWGYLVPVEEIQHDAVVKFKGNGVFVVVSG